MIERVGAWLGYPPDGMWRLEQVDGPPNDAFALPDDIGDVLDRVDVPPDAISEIVGAMPSPHSDPEAWWLLGRLYHQVTDRVGPVIEPPWPAPFLTDDPLTHHFHLYVYLAAIPDLLAFHARRRVPEEVTWSTLRDIGLQVDAYWRREGRFGFDGAFWMWPHFRGHVFRLGRLQYDVRRIGFDPPTEAGFRRADPALGVHIPSYGRLDPSACDESVAHARAFFRSHYADVPIKIATCESWLLDPQLAEHLPAASNIVRFQSRFTLVEGWSQPGDDTVVRFVFGRLPASLDDLPRTTTLQRAIVEHLEAGRHWKVHLGWFGL